MKKFFSMMLALALLICILAPNGRAFAARTPAPPDSELAARAGARTMYLLENTLNPALHPVYMKLKFTEDSGAVIMTIAKKNGMTATDIKSASQHIGSLVKDGVSYLILHDEKAYLQNKPLPLPAGVSVLAGDASAEPSAARFTAGTEEIGKTVYEYDELTGRESTWFYYEPKTDQWKYMRTGSGLVEVLAYGDAADDALFSIPADYTEMNLSGMPGNLF